MLKPTMDNLSYTANCPICLLQESTVRRDTEAQMLMLLVPSKATPVFPSCLWLADKNATANKCQKLLLFWTCWLLLLATLRTCSGAGLSVAPVDRCENALRSMQDVACDRRWLQEWFERLSASWQERVEIGASLQARVETDAGLKE